MEDLRLHCVKEYSNKVGGDNIFFEYAQLQWSKCQSTFDKTCADTVMDIIKKNMKEEVNKCISKSFIGNDWEKDENT